MLDSERLLCLDSDPQWPVRWMKRAAVSVEVWQFQPSMVVYSGAKKYILVFTIDDTKSHVHALYRKLNE